MNGTTTQHFETIKILLVEDDRDDAELMSFVLDNDELVIFEVDHVESLHEALAHIASLNCDIILLDLTLPDCWGVETVREIHRHAPALPVIALTDRHDPEQALTITQAGAFGYLCKKTFTSDVVGRMVHDALRSRHRKPRPIQQKPPQPHPEQAPKGGPALPHTPGSDRAKGEKIETTAQQFETINVLLVEDDRDDVELMSFVLDNDESVIFETDQVESLHEALAHIASLNHDIILLDLTLPDCWGIETVRQIRRHAPTLPIIALTDRHDPELALTITQAGAFGYLCKKTFTSDAVDRMVRDALRAQHRKPRPIKQKQRQPRASQLTNDGPAILHTLGIDRASGTRAHGYPPLRVLLLLVLCLCIGFSAGELFNLYNLTTLHEATSPAIPAVLSMQSKFHAITQLTLDEVKHNLPWQIDFHPPRYSPDHDAILITGKTDLPEQAGQLLINVYLTDAQTGNVGGIEITADAEQQAGIITADRLDLIARDAFLNVMSLKCFTADREPMKQWLKTVLPMMRTASVVKLATRGDLRYTCYGTPWTRTLEISAPSAR